MRLVSREQLLEQYIFEKFVDNRSLLANEILRWVPMEVPYFHVIYAGTEDAPFIIGYRCNDEPFENEEVNPKCCFTGILHQMCRGGYKSATWESLVFLSTVYFQLRDKVDILSVIRNYDPEAPKDPVGQLLLDSYGRLVYDHQLVYLYKLAERRISLSRAREFADTINENPDTSVLRLKLPTGQTIEEVIAEYGLGNKITYPSWYMATRVKQALKWVEKYE